MSNSDFRRRVQALLQHWSITDTTLADPWLDNMRPESRPAGELLVRAGDTGDNLYVLESGLVRLFYITPDGKERNKAFFAAGDVTGPVSAILNRTAAPFSIECLEPVEAIAFRHRDLEVARKGNPQLAQLYTQLLAQAFVRNEQREAMLLTLNAEQRYRWLSEHEPELLQRVPQFHIASYLGVDAVSLSRLKRKITD